LPFIFVSVLALGGRRKVARSVSLRLTALAFEERVSSDDIPLFLCGFLFLPVNGCFTSLMILKYFRLEILILF
jgi:hypothetical protein